MSATTLEQVLARLLVDSVYREAFLRDADVLLAREDLTDDERRAVKAMDRAGLVLAARSASKKRGH